MHSNPVRLETDLFNTQLVIGFDFSSGFPSHGFSSFISLFDMVLRVVNRTEMAARGHRKAHDVEQTEKVIPFITSEIAFRQHVCESFFGFLVSTYLTWF